MDTGGQKTQRDDVCGRRFNKSEHSGQVILTIFNMGLSTNLRPKLNIQYLICFNIVLYNTYYVEGNFVQGLGLAGLELYSLTSPRWT